MNIKVDWLSLTLPLVRGVGDVETDEASHAINDTMRQWMPERDILAIFDGANEAGGGRTPYSNSWHFPSTLVTVYANPKLDHILLEFSGQSCEVMRQLGVMERLLAIGRKRATRLDIAIDIPTTTKPVDFVGKGHNERFKTVGQYDSQSGQTVYIGSQKSERFCRVYRYAEPHPRAKLLRVEYVMRRDHAKVAAAAINARGIENVAQGLSEAYGWQSLEIYQEGVEAAEIAVERPEKARKNAVRWLITQVAPAFQRLVREGNIADAQTFLEEHFLKGI